MISISTIPRENHNIIVTWNNSKIVFNVSDESKMIWLLKNRNISGIWKIKNLKL